MKKGSKKDSKKFIIVIVIILLALCGFLYFKTMTGNLVLTDYSKTDYGPPFDVFNRNASVFNISSDYLVAVNDLVNLGANVSIDGYIYKRGYIYNHQLKSWEVFSFDQTPIEGSYWIEGFASKDLVITASRALQNGENYIIAYACKGIKVNDQWSCGCQTADQENCSNWMLHVFNVTNVIVVPDTKCTEDANCTFVGGKCNLGSGLCESDVICVSNCSCVSSTLVGESCSDGCGGSCEGTKPRDGSIFASFAISNCEQLQNISTNLNANYELINDIDCSETRNWNGGKGFISIGGLDFYSKLGLGGTFDGNNFVISGLFINNNVWNNSIGLFSYNYGEIRNLKIINADISFGGIRGGILTANNYGSINSVQINYSKLDCGNTRPPNWPWDLSSPCGGLAGFNQGVVSKSSVSNTQITGRGMSRGYTTNLGGLVQWNEDGSFISDSYVDNVSITPFYGDVYSGLIAGINKGFIKNSYSANSNSYFVTLNIGIIENSFNLYNYFGLGRSGSSLGAITNSYFLNSSSSSPCFKIYPSGETTTCTPIADINYFKNSNNQPMSSWDTNIWTFTQGEYPKLKWQN